MVGQLWAIIANQDFTARGCYLFATANRIQALSMATVKECGHVVIASDEEALALAGDRALDHISAAAIAYPFLAQTGAHKAVLLDRFPNANITVTGSARVELLHATKPKPATPPYVLFNTNFSLVNSMRGDVEKALTIMGRGMSLTTQGVKLRFDGEKAGVECMVPVIRWLLPQCRVVIRPHPTEKAQAWRDAFPEAEVVEGSDLLPWIRGALVVVHANSTTGLEAALIGVPSINLDPIESWGARFTVRNYNHTVKTATEAIEAVAAYLQGKTVKQPVAKPPFPIEGAKNTATVISAALGPSSVPDKLPWRRAVRTKDMRDKFTATRENIVNNPHIKAAGPSAVHELDDSVFLLAPNVR